MRDRSEGREAAIELGRMVAAGRAAGLSWKMLAQQLGLSRTRLFVLQRKAEKRELVERKRKKRG
jgi:hypothetical protein